jgi:hypothetical protein
MDSEGFSQLSSPGSLALTTEVMERRGVHSTLKMGSPPRPLSAPKPVTALVPSLTNLSFSRAPIIREHWHPASTPGK